MEKQIIPVKKVGDPTGKELFQRIDKALESIRNRAYEMFRLRGNEPGTDLDDWFRAERELFEIPPFELADNGDAFLLKVAMPRYEIDQLEVGVEGDSVTIYGKVDRKRTERGEFTHEELFRRFNLPGPIDANNVRSQLADGFLKLTLPKAKAKEERKAAA
jgi:HSP20 family molecular chaperone IbpA